MLKKKLISKRGFTLTEMLVTAAIVVLVALAVTVGVSAATKAYHDITRSSEASILCGTLAVELSDELRFARNIDNTSDPISFDSPRFGTDVSIGQDAQGYVTVGGDNNPVLPATAYTSKLKAEAAITYDSSAEEYTLTVTVNSPAGDPIETATIKVSPLDEQ